MIFFSQKKHIPLWSLKMAMALFVRWTRIGSSVAGFFGGVFFLLCPFLIILGGAPRIWLVGRSHIVQDKSSSFFADISACINPQRQDKHG